MSGEKMAAGKMLNALGGTAFLFLFFPLSYFFFSFYLDRLRLV